MKHFLNLSVFLVLTVVFSGCINSDFISENHVTGIGATKIEARDIKNFDEVEIANNSDVEIYKSSNLTVEVSDYSNLVKYTVVKVVGHRLIIKTEPDNINLSNSNSKVIIHIPDNLKVLLISGSGNMYLKDDFANISTISISGSGNIETEKPCTLNNITATVSGSGEIDFKGTANSSTLQVSGSGDIDFSEVKSQNVVSQISGSGSISLFAIGSLDANISGSGDIEYYGDPTVNSSVSGSGSVNHNE